MADFFKMNTKDIKKLSQTFANMRKEIKRATADMINKLAFKTMENAKKRIHTTMTIRSKSFIDRQFLYKSASRFDNINRQMSVAATRKSERFSGWVEQEHGTRQGGKEGKRRISKYHGRDGNWRNEAIGQARLKDNQKFIRPPATDGKAVIPWIMKQKRKKGRRKAFLINSKYKTLRKGLYIFVGKGKDSELKRLQSFDNKPRKVRRNRFMTWAINTTKKRFNTAKEWDRSLKKIWPKVKKR